MRDLRRRCSTRNGVVYRCSVAVRGMDVLRVTGAVVVLPLKRSSDARSKGGRAGRVGRSRVSRTVLSGAGGSVHYPTPGSIWPHVELY